MRMCLYTNRCSRFKLYCFCNNKLKKKKEKKKRNTEKCFSRSHSPTECDSLIKGLTHSVPLRCWFPGHGKPNQLGGSETTRNMWSFYLHDLQISSWHGYQPRSSSKLKYRECVEFYLHDFQIWSFHGYWPRNNSKLKYRECVEFYLHDFQISRHGF